MKQNIVVAAQNVIRLRREKAEQTARDNLLSALKNKEFKQCYEAYQSEKIESAKCQALGEKENGNLNLAKKNLENVMKKLKISEVVPNYSCHKCNDLGKIDGKYCDCLKKEIALILLKQSGFDKLEKFEKTTFDLFEDKPRAKQIYSLMQKWCEQNSQKSTILICGPTGTGKTHLTKCMAQKLIERGVITQIISAFSLGQKFLAIHTASEDDKLQKIDELLNIEALIIDDLGTEPKYRNVTKEYLYLLINERQIRGLKTIITTNLYPDNIMEQYDERIFSRLIDKDKCILIEMKGKDLRLMQKGKA